jgi:hypothetical protein
MQNTDEESKSERRPYYKEPDTKYGRPRIRIKKTPPGSFSLAQHDELASQLDARGYLNEIVRRDTWHEFKQEHPDFRELGIAPGFETVDDINRFLVRLDPVTIVKDGKRAKHALLLNMVLIAIDPNVPDLEARLRNVGQEIREQHPLPVTRPPGRPPKSGDIDGVCQADVHAWRDHRVLALRELEHMGYSPGKDRKQLARWLFPEIADETKRGRKFDKAVVLLEQLCAAVRVIDAQTRT